MRINFTLDTKEINQIELETMREMFARASQAKLIDIEFRINGSYERYQADWLKHVKED